MITTRAAVLDEIGAPLELSDIRVDDPEPHEVRVAVTNVGLCHSDLHYMTGTVPTEASVAASTMKPEPVTPADTSWTIWQPRNPVRILRQPRPGQQQIFFSR
jgi:NADPH:quinone reductase-like Zn-dependent oxidoreductase